MRQEAVAQTRRNSSLNRWSRDQGWFQQRLRFDDITESTTLESGSNLNPIVRHTLDYIEGRLEYIYKI